MDGALADDKFVLTIAADGNVVAPNIKRRIKHTLNRPRLLGTSGATLHQQEEESQVYICLRSEDVGKVVSCFKNKCSKSLHTFLMYSLGQNVIRFFQAMIKNKKTNILRVILHF